MVPYIRAKKWSNAMLPTAPFAHLFQTSSLDRLFNDMLDINSQMIRGNNFPPHNIKSFKDDATNYQIELAVAGYPKENLTVVQDGRKLKITGLAVEQDDTLLHHGISHRAFTKTFIVVDGSEVTDVSLKDGLLVIKLKLKTPVEGRVIEIN